jgi:glutamine cyclotransferase
MPKIKIGFSMQLLERWKGLIHWIIGLVCLSTYPYLVGAQIEQLVLKIVSIRPHDTSAFTQGLSIKGDILYESVGLYGKSGLRQIDLQTNQVIRQLSLPPNYFAEGIALFGDQLIQTTWKEGIAFVYNQTKWSVEKIHSYKGEGWGLCCDGERLFMTNGSDTIFMRDPHTFSTIGKYSVRFKNQKVSFLNDLECADESLYLNVWGKNLILRLNKTTGQITGIIDASGLLTAQEEAAVGPEGVLNGIAYHLERRTFFITGKYWPWLFEVQFIPAHL